MGFKSPRLHQTRSPETRKSLGAFFFAGSKAGRSTQVVSKSLSAQGVPLLAWLPPAQAPNRCKSASFGKAIWLEGENKSVPLFPQRAGSHGIVRRLLALNLERSKPTAEWVAAPAGAVIGMTCSQLLVAGGWWLVARHHPTVRKVGTQPVRTEKRCAPNRCAIR